MFFQADSYERFMGRWSRLLAPALLAFSDLRDGDTLLDVGSGTGSLSFAARDSTKTSRIFGIDPSRDYVAHAASKNTDPRVYFEVGDARKLPFPDAAFDKTMSLLVLNFIPDAALAVREWTRVTKPSGIVCAAVWDYGEEMQMLRAFWDEASAFDPAAEASHETRMALCRRGELGALWRQVGLENVEEVPLTIAQHFASFDDYWAPFLLGQGPAGAFVARLPQDRQAALEARLRARLCGSVDRALDMQARAWAVKGTLPSRNAAPPA